MLLGGAGADTEKARPKQVTVPSVTHLGWAWAGPEGARPKQVTVSSVTHLGGAGEDPEAMQGMRANAFPVPGLNPVKPEP